MGAILKKTKVALAFFSAFCAQHSPAQENETPAQVRIIGHYENAVGTSDAASQGTITPQLIEARPMLRPGEVLEYVPGVIITQHSGDGKANQYFLRGFNLDHGTDFLTTIDHMPVNLPTHAHGQGYSDINFLLPELVSRIAYKKGPYFAEEGDFSSAGAADIDYYTKMPKGIASLGLGGNGYRRAMAANSFDSGPGHLLYGFELFHNDGPWINPEDYRKLNGVLRFSQGTNADGYTLSLMGYTGKWNATDQIPQRAVDDGTISRFGAIDPTDGGKTSRYSLSLDRHKTLENGAVFHMDVYAIKYRLNLFSNFTYFLDHPFPIGDQFEQADDRTVVGLTPRWVFTENWGARQMTHKLGVDARRDDINVALYNTSSRQRMDTTPSTARSDRVLQTGVGLYYENAIQWTDTFRSIAGVREDFYNARVDSDLAGNSRTTSARIGSPKLSFIFGPFDRTEYFLNYGQGFHSNDARGTTITAGTKVPALVKTRGEEIGMRTEVVPHLQSSLSLWRLALDSELVFKGDTGTTEASRPSLRRGIEWSNRYIPHDWLLVDLDLSASRAQFTDGDPAGKGSYIPGAVDRVASLGVTVKDLGPWSGTVHARYFGARPLTEDNSARSQSSVIFSARASYKLDAKTSVNFDVFNLFNRDANDIEYYYASQLQNETAPTSRIHFHPAEPRTARLALVARY